MEDKSLTLVTYNLDHKSICHEERLNAFILQIRDIDPDVVVIQEGTRDIYPKLFLMMKHMGYKFQQFPEIQKRKCSEMIFTKLPFTKAYYKRFQCTQQERGFSTYTLDVHGKQIQIVTTQLECGVHRASFLRKQITEIQKLFTDPVIFLGDFQISDFQHNIKQPSGWIDAWEEAGVSKEKYSVDYKINTLANVQDRPDRIWFLPKNVLECEECRLVGLPIPRQEHLFVSEHFGVRAKFLIN